MEKDSYEIIEEVQYLAKSIDPRRDRIINEDNDSIKDNEELEEEIDSINDKRNKIITLQLYLERSIDRIIKITLNKKIGSYYGKIEFLKSRKFINSDQFFNLDIINQLRRDYAHILDIKDIEPKYNNLVEKLKLSGHISANSHYDKFQLIIHQILFELKDIYDKELAKRNGKEIEKGLTDKEIKGILEKDGELSWNFCKILKYEKMGYDETYELECPYCGIGKIIREKDMTPGFKESYFRECSNCGLSGDGSTLDIKTIESNQTN